MKECAAANEVTTRRDRRDRKRTRSLALPSVPPRPASLLSLSLSLSPSLPSFSFGVSLITEMPRCDPKTFRPSSAAASEKCSRLAESALERNVAAAGSQRVRVVQHGVG